MTVFLIILGYLVTCVIFGAITSFIGGEKGYDGGFWWGFLLGILGVLIVCGRPDMNTQNMVKQILYEVGNIQRVCDNNFAPNSVSFNNKMLSKDGWKCNCGRINPGYQTTCVCGKGKDEVLRNQANNEKQ